ncbi:Uma2 family endonuclease [Saccharothrix sp. Mg75]|uniref:Uma2 family endonuclease n=1 Tax=Saccharothrix sp. Mg75 TaxID=3445357 RepID=UPI003EEA2332
MMIGSHTVDDWLTAPDPEGCPHGELIFGHLRSTPHRSVRHQVAVGRLTHAIRDAVHAAGRTDLHAVWTVNVRFPIASRTVLIPDAVVVRERVRGLMFPASAVVLSVEVWSPEDEPAYRETKLAAYALAGVPFVWTVEREAELTAHRLVRGRYVVQNVVRGVPTVIGASPVPVEVGPADLMDP